jgi:hypothetical protein
MRKRSKVLFTGLTAALLLALAVGTASANRLSVSAQDWEARFVSLEFIAGGSTIRCPVTLQGSFHSRTIVKTAHALIGHVSRASVIGSAGTGACTGGTATVLTATLPWHVTYEFFTGTLPNITGIGLLLIGASFQVQPRESLTCLARTTTTDPALGTVGVSGGRATELTADPSAEIPLTGSGGLCVFGGEGHFGGTSRPLTRLNSTASISVTLI